MYEIKCYYYKWLYSCWTSVLRYFFFTAMLFVHGRILSQRLVNTVTSDKFLYQFVSTLIKYHMAVCYFLYITGWLLFFLSFCIVLQVLQVLYYYLFPSLIDNLLLYIYHGWFLYPQATILLYMNYQTFIYNGWLLIKILFVILLRLCVVHSLIKEEAVQVSIWPVCMDSHDSDCGLYTIFLHCGQHFWRNILVTLYLEWTAVLFLYSTQCYSNFSFLQCSNLNNTLLSNVTFDT